MNFALCIVSPFLWASVPVLALNNPRIQAATAPLAVLMSASDNVISVDAAADATGVSKELIEQLMPKQVVKGTSWAHAVVVTNHNFNPPLALSDALVEATKFPGFHRGWTLYFEDGSKLSHVKAGQGPKKGVQYVETDHDAPLQKS
mmetsp:Transcript_25562/g.51983  ORF Transcript_25562/g.51983 Transcript_25562/m.51983 type:complete len:146 (+) Transcript_25562:1-438(+)